MFGKCLKRKGVNDVNWIEKVSINAQFRLVKRITSYNQQILIVFLFVFLYH